MFSLIVIILQNKNENILRVYRLRIANCESGSVQGLFIFIVQVDVVDERIIVPHLYIVFCVFVHSFALGMSCSSNTLLANLGITTSFPNLDIHQSHSL